MSRVTILTPCYNEEANVRELYRQVRDAIADEQETADNAGGWQPERTATERQY